MTAHTKLSTDYACLGHGTARVFRRWL